MIPKRTSTIQKSLSVDLSPPTLSDVVIRSAITASATLPVKRRGRPRGTARTYTLRLGGPRLSSERISGARSLRDARTIASAYMALRAPRVPFPGFSVVRLHFETRPALRVPEPIDVATDTWIEIVYHSPRVIDRSSAEGE